MFDEVISTLLGRLPTYREATVQGWTVERLPGRVYPGLGQRPGCFARGRIYSGLTMEEWTLLDNFEDPEYVLDSIGSVIHSGRLLSYVWPGSMLPEEWNADQFRSRDLAEYLDRCETWRAGYLADLRRDGLRNA